MTPRSLRPLLHGVIIATIVLLLGCGKKDAPAPLTEKQKTEVADFAKRAAPHAAAFRLAMDAAAQGQYAVAIGLLENLADKAPDVPEFRQLATFFRKAQQANIQLNIQKAAAQSRHRLTYQQLKLADRICVQRLSKNFIALGQMPASQRAAAAPELLDEVKKLTLDEPDYPRAWLMQASLCLMLDRSLEGKIAGKNLIELRAQESVAPEVQALLKQLQTKGWLPADTKLPPQVAAKKV
jgi:sulfur relay (sulfurtransferase) complex TusBCD TusD component (DsrE family)